MSEGPAATLQAFDAALNAHDLEGVMRLFAESAVVRYVPAPPPPSPATYVGKGEVRTLIERLIAENIRVEPEQYEAEGERVISRDRKTCAAGHEKLGCNPVILTCEAIVHRGRIEEMTFAFSPESLARLRAAMVQRRQAEREM